ncbi:MAG: hypothetical protein AAFP79_05105 [Pseudomonadota bacterium]
MSLDTITITKLDLEDALKRWSEEAAANKWPERDDETRHNDNAEYLWSLLSGQHS